MKYIEAFFNIIFGGISVLIGAVIGLVIAIVLLSKYGGGLNIPPEGLEGAALIAGVLIGAVLGYVFRRFTIWIFEGFSGGSFGD